MDLSPFSPCTPQSARFEHVSDCSLVPLDFDKSVAWGPYILDKNVKPELVKRYNFDPVLHVFGRGHHTGPTSKASAAPVTSYVWLEFMVLVYFHPENMSFFSVPGTDRHLSGGQIEFASAAFNNT